MQCPIDQTDLLMMERSGIEIDYCPKCRGVWLDRGELDKLIAQAGQRETAYPPAAPRPENRGQYYDDDDYKRKNDEGYYRDHPDQRPYPRKKNFLSEMFDIFD